MPEMLSSLAGAGAHAVPVFQAPQVTLLGCLGWEPPYYIRPLINQGFCLFHLASDSFGGWGGKATGGLYEKINMVIHKNCIQCQVIMDVLKFYVGLPTPHLKGHEFKLRLSLYILGSKHLATHGS